MYNVIIFETIRCYLTALRNTVHSILNYKRMRHVSILRLPREQKKQKQQLKKKSECRRH